ncbi:Bikaverin cluster transcription factor bik5 [Lachnellula suecica]|uniref:Bikaverin cluster transcription factor bik5 n=1 Tax=Lachnellula suecica TaxID=602035 RepID=A0A8T9CE33_9HELO|nr:Bikaverin cluster transcription factor bik5 [Lachnellula suecica]
MFAQPHSAPAPPSSSTATPEQSAAPAPTDPNLPQNHTPDAKKASNSAPHALAARSCVTCRRRKVKCDKTVPCSNCAKAGSQCVFPAPGRAPRRPRAGGKVVSEREAELLKRLRRLEGVVDELSGQVEMEAVKQSPSSDHSSPSQQKDTESTGDPSHKPASVRVVGMDEGSGTKKEWINRAWRIGGGPPKSAFLTTESPTSEIGIGRLVFDEGKSRYVSHPFWSQITDEVDEIREMLADHEFNSDSDTPVAPNDSVTEPNHQSFIMGYNSSDVNLKNLHPLPSQIPFYWQAFLENVHPLVKLLHAPTMGKTIKEIQNNLDSLGKSTEALMFAIYFATITSMNGNEVQTNFGVSKEHLIRQYRFGTEQALARAGLLNTNEIVTVQAFVLFLVCVRRHDDTRFVWSMTGLAIRVAQGLGLHRDGAKFGLPPFDTEMRRRLWWQICILDTRASEDHGSDPSILDYSFDTEFPISCNDEDLEPNAKEPPARRPGVSEMTFCLIRYEICFLTRQLSYSPPGAASYKLQNKELTLEDKEVLVRETSKRLEDKYLQYCEDAGPLYWVAATVARLITAKMSLILYHPLTQPGNSNTLSQDTRDRLFMASIEIIEYSRVLEEESSTKQWGWLFQTYIQWHAIAYILGELCSRENSTIVERAWRAIDGVFGDWGAAVTHSKSGQLWKPLKKLMSRARKKRVENANIDVKHIGLGMPQGLIQPEPEGYPSAMPTRDRLMPAITDTTYRTPNGDPLANPNFAYQIQADTAMMEPQIVGMGMLAPHQVQQQLQQQPPQQTPWLMDENALLDLDMNLDGDVNWEGWDDLVRDFQMEAGNQPPGDQRGPTLGGMGTWW